MSSASGALSANCRRQNKQRNKGPHEVNQRLLRAFSELGKQISAALPNVRAVIDGEICSLDRRGRPQFKNLMFRRGNPPCFFAFDLLSCDGMDLRTERLIDRKQELRRLLAWAPADSPLKYTEYVSVVEVDNYTIPQNTYIFPAAGPICPTGNGCGNTVYNIFSVNQNFRTPYNYNYNLNLEQSLSNSVLLTLGYVGS
ncbi:MAG: hypothetical protein DMG97_33915, partial [Acidobacteria bacterium]